MNPKKSKISEYGGERQLCLHLLPPGPAAASPRGRQFSSPAAPLAKATAWQRSCRNPEGSRSTAANLCSF